MARRIVLEDPDPRLRQPSVAVSVFDGPFHALVDDLVDTLRATGGIGLSAPQIDVRLAVVLLDLSGSGAAPEVYVNPEVVEGRAPGLVEERCLSVPGVVGSVVRHTRLRVRAQDVDGRPFERDVEGLRAVCLGHEMDHLEGRLFTDRLWIGSRIHRALAGLWGPRAA